MASTGMAGTGRLGCGEAPSELGTKQSTKTSEDVFRIRAFRDSSEAETTDHLVSLFTA
jgi:hypothetical protein